MHGVAIFFLDKEPRLFSSSPPCFPGASQALSSPLSFQMLALSCYPKTEDSIVKVPHLWIT